MPFFTFIGTNLTNLASSVETLRSLSRLFPHLSEELNTNGANIEEPSPPKMIADQPEYVLSDLSAASSLTSSYSRSGMGKLTPLLIVQNSLKR